MNVFICDVFIEFIFRYGASAVVPYVAFDAVINWHGQKRVQNSMEKGDIQLMSASKALYNFRFTDSSKVIMLFRMNMNICLFKKEKQSIKGC